MHEGDLGVAAARSGRLGVVGGLGPDATARFYRLLNVAYRRASGGRSPDVVLYNVPLEHRLERAFVTGRASVLDSEELARLLESACEVLRDAGCDVFAVPCNTAQLILPLWAGPRVDIIDATCERVLQREVRRVGLLATAVTARSGVYQQSLETAGIAVATPDRHGQQQVGEIIDRILLGRHTDDDQRSVAGVVSRLGEIDAVILGCTDLGDLVGSADLGLPVIDSVNCLVDAACDALMGHLTATVPAVAAVTGVSPVCAAAKWAS